MLVILPLIVPMIDRFGLAGAAVTVTAGIAVQWLVGLVFLRRLVGITLRAVAQALWRPVWMTVLMAMSVAVVMNHVDPMSVAGLGAAIVTGVVVYGILSLPVLLALKRERLS